MYLPVQENINNHNLFYMSKIENFLSNTKMGRLIASYLGKTNLAVDEKGKVSLTDEEKEKIRTMYGADFLAKFEAMDFNASEDNARELFDSAVQYKAQELAATKALIWPLFYTGVFYLIFNGLLTILFSRAEKRLNYYRG